MNDAAKFLINVIAASVHLSAAEIIVCAAAFEPIRFKRGAIIEAAGKPPRYLYFVAEGYLRLYHHADSDEVTSLLGSPGTFITSFLSFANQRVSSENVECITECALCRIEYAALRALIDRSEQLKGFSLLLFEKAIGDATCRANDFATLTATQRYEKLVSQDPALLHHIPVRYLASYLGIKPQSLSRIRAQRIK